MKINGKKIAVSGLARVVLTPMIKKDDFVLVHKKGEKYIEFNLKYPFLHKLEYTENIYRYTLLFSMNDEFEESYILGRYTYLCLKDNEFYVKPNVTIVYIDGKERTEYFDTNQEAKERYDELSNKCKLVEIVNG